MRHVAAGVHVVGAVVVGGLDDPLVLVRADLRHVDVVVVQKRRHRHGLLDERDLVAVQELQGSLVEQHLEYLLVVHDVPGEAADERHLLGAHRVEKLLGVVPVVDDVVGDAAPPDGVDALAVLVVQRLAVEGKLAHVGHHALDAALAEQIGVDVELVHHAVLQVVADGDARVLHAAGVGGVDVQERLHPRLEQLAALHPVAARELLERF